MLKFIIFGSHLGMGSTVTIDGNPGTIVTATNDAVTVLTPPGSIGTVVVALTTGYGVTLTTSYTHF
ncbi:MAG: IPT/TIG domain-containing protein [Planctomycetota bacterium]